MAKRLEDIAGNSVSHTQIDHLLITCHWGKLDEVLDWLRTHGYHVVSEGPVSDGSGAIIEAEIKTSVTYD